MTPRLPRPAPPWYIRGEGLDGYAGSQKAPVGQPPGALQFQRTMPTSIHPPTPDRPMTNEEENEAGDLSPRVYTLDQETWEAFIEACENPSPETIAKLGWLS